MPKKTTADYYTRSGAAQLADRIDAYWRNRGFRGVSVTRYQDPNFPGLWFVRSNIGAAGYPPRRAITYGKALV